MTKSKLKQRGLATWTNNNTQTLCPGSRALRDTRFLMPLPPDLEREQRRFQQKIDSIDQEDDPLDIYYSYARWLEDNYQPQEANDSGLIDLLEQATQQLGGDPIAKNDLRCLKLWIMYAKYVEDSASVFNHVYTNNIGTKYALLYEEYAELLERTG